MGEYDASKGGRSLYHESIRLLACEFQLHSNSPELINLLSHITQRADQDVPVTHCSPITVTWTGDEYRISSDDVEDDFEL